MESSVAKLFIADAVNESCHKALQIFGGEGHTKYNDIERYARDGRLLDIGVGTSEVLKDGRGWCSGEIAGLDV